MKGVKGKLLRKLKSIPQVTAGSFHFDIHLPPDPARVFRDLSNSAFSSGGGGAVKAAGVKCQKQVPADHQISSRDFDDGNLDLRRVSSLPTSPFSNGGCDDGGKAELQCDPVPTVPEMPGKIGDDDIHDSDNEDWFDDGYPDKENAGPFEAPEPAEDPSIWEEANRTDGSPKNSTLFRRPRLSSPTLFDPDLLAAFQKAVDDYRRSRDDFRGSARPAVSAVETPHHPSDQRPSPSDPGCRSHDPLKRFELRCPPGGADAVVLYTTSLRGIRKTFEDCSRVRHLLRSLRVSFFERDVSMHAGFRDELWAVLGGGRVIPPRLFVKGRYVGGADDVVGLHERGELLKMLGGMILPAGATGSEECGDCGGFMFLLCSECRGSRKVYLEDRFNAAAPEQCRRCNENGLVVCGRCSSDDDGR